MIKHITPTKKFAEYTITQEQRSEIETKNNIKRFFKKFFYRILSRILELATLFGIGYLLGLKLIRY